MKKYILILFLNIISVFAIAQTCGCNLTGYPQTIDEFVPDVSIEVLDPNMVPIDTIEVPSNFYSFPLGVWYNTVSLVNGTTDDFTIRYLAGSPEFTDVWDWFWVCPDYYGNYSALGTFFASLNPGETEDPVFYQTGSWDGNDNGVGNCIDPTENFSVTNPCDFGIYVEGDGCTLDNTAVTLLWKSLNTQLISNITGEFQDTIDMQLGGGPHTLQYVDLLGNNCDAKITIQFNGQVTENILQSGGTMVLNPVNAACNAALPVELTYFVATKINELENELRWQTASEDGNSHFELQHSTSLSNFEVIETIQGAGTTQSVQNYKARHTPVKAGEYDYYRLKQIDLDGDFEYSKIVVVKGGKGTDEISVRPTEVKTTATIVFPESQVDEILEVFNLQGQKVMSKKIEAGNTVAYVDFSSIASGMYFVRLGKRVSTKFIKI